MHPMSVSRVVKFLLLLGGAGGTLFAGTCDAVLQTIGLAFSIVDVWV